MKILAISDVEEWWLDDGFDARRLEGVRLIVSCGDLPSDYLERIVTLANIPVAYVRGNHDVHYDLRPPGGCIDLEGQVRDFHGLRIAGLGGSIRYNDRVWGFTEQEMRWRAARLALLAQASGGIDVLVTHAPPRGWGDMDDYPHRGFEAFNNLLERLQPRYLLHGHVHMEYGRVERELVHSCGTRIVNACGSYVVEVPDELLAARAQTGGTFFKPKPL